MSQSQQQSSASAELPKLPPPGPLPIPHLESLKFKATQLIEAINSLACMLQVDVAPGMPLPPWPDIMNKYSIFLSQTHTFSVALASVAGIGTGAGSSGLDTAPTVGGTGGGKSGLAQLALHPRAGMPEAHFESEVIPLLRNQQTTDVLRRENETVRRLAEQMGTRGMLGALGVEQAGGGTRVEYEDVIRECERIRDEHDRRVDRAVRAVGMLREKYEWKARVEVENEEPEDADFGEDSFIGRANAMDMEDMNRASQEGQGNGNISEGNSSDGDEEELENVLGTGTEATPEPNEDVPMQ